MPDYQSKYEQYKEELTKNKRFMNDFGIIHDNVIRNYKDYIDRESSISNISILSGILGFFVGIYSPDLSSFFLRFVLIAAICICGYLIYIVYKKFIASSGKREFYLYYVKSHIQDQVFSDYQKETDMMLQEFNGRILNIKYYAEILQSKSATESDNEDLSSLLYWISTLDDFSTKYRSISSIPQYAKDLNDDYYFSAEFHKYIHK